MTNSSSHPTNLKEILNDYRSLALLIIILAVFCLSNIPYHPDFAAGQTIGSRFLEGQRPYIDIVENNPPMTFYMHLPAAMLERLTGIRGEVWQNILSFLTCLGVIGLGEWLRTGYAIPKNSDSAQRVSIFLFTLLIMPMTSFGSRDQMTFVLMWPMLVLQAEDMVKERTLSPWIYASVGLLAGLGTTIKFYFVLGPIFGSLYLCYAKRSFKPIFGIENMTAALFCFAYLGSIFWLHPTYIDFIYPMLPYTYFTGHPTLIYLLRNGLLVFSGLYVVIAICKGDERLKDPRARVLLICGVGFIASYFAFTRNLPFRYLPPASCLFMAFAAADNHSKRPKLLMLYEATILGLCAWYMLFTNPARPDATAFIKSLKIDKPNILLLALDLGDGHPLIRDVGGRMVNPGLHPWVTLGVTITMRNDPVSPELMTKFNEWSNWERELMAKEWKAHSPDLILVSLDRYLDWVEWARQNPFMNEQLDQYKNIGLYDRMTIMARKTPEDLAGEAQGKPKSD